MAKTKASPRDKTIAHCQKQIDSLNTVIKLVKEFPLNVPLHIIFRGYTRETRKWGEHSAAIIPLGFTGTALRVALLASDNVYPLGNYPYTHRRGCTTILSYRSILRFNTLPNQDLPLFLRCANKSKHFEDLLSGKDIDCEGIYRLGWKS